MKCAAAVIFSVRGRSFLSKRIVNQAGIERSSIETT